MKDKRIKSQLYKLVGCLNAKEMGTHLDNGL